MYAKYGQSSILLEFTRINRLRPLQRGLPYLVLQEKVPGKICILIQLTIDFSSWNLRSIRRVKQDSDCESVLVKNPSLELIVESKEGYVIETMIPAMMTEDVSPLKNISMTEKLSRQVKMDIISIAST